MSRVLLTTQVNKPNDPNSINVTGLVRQAYATDAFTGWTQPNGPVTVFNLGSLGQNDPDSRALAQGGSSGTGKIALMTTGLWRDCQVTAYQNGYYFIDMYQDPNTGLYSGWSFQHVPSVANGFAQLGYFTGLSITNIPFVSGNGTLTPYVSENGTLVAKYGANGSITPSNYTTAYQIGDSFTFKRLGFDLTVSFTREGVTTIWAGFSQTISTMWSTNRAGAIALCPKITLGIAGTISAGFLSAPAVYSNLSDPNNIKLDVRDDPMIRSLAATGSMTAGSQTFTINGSNPGFLKNHNVIVEIGITSLAARTKTGGNIGNGTAKPGYNEQIQSGYTAGDYVVSFTSADAITVTDPNSVLVGTATFATGALGRYIWWENQINFRIDEGATPFATGDGFVFTVTATGETAAAGFDGKPACGRRGTIGVGGAGPLNFAATDAAVFATSAAHGTYYRSVESGKVWQRYDFYATSIIGDISTSSGVTTLMQTSGPVSQSSFHGTSLGTDFFYLHGGAAIQGTGISPGTYIIATEWTGSTWKYTLNQPATSGTGITVTPYPWSYYQCAKFYQGKAVPFSLLATITNVVGNVLTLSATSQAATNGARILLDVTSAVNNYTNNTPVVPPTTVEMTFPDGTFYTSDAIYIRSKTGWTLKSVSGDATRTIFEAARGVPSRGPTMNAAFYSSFLNLGHRGQHNAGGVGLGWGFTDPAVPDTAPGNGFMITGSSENCLIDGCKVWNAPTNAFEMDHGHYSLVKNSAAYMQWPRQSYVNWLVDQVYSQGSEYRDVTVDSDYLINGLQAWGNGPQIDADYATWPWTKFTRVTMRNCATSFNSISKCDTDELVSIVERGSHALYVAQPFPLNNGVWTPTPNAKNAGQPYGHGDGGILRNATLDVLGLVNDLGDSIRPVIINPGCDGWTITGTYNPVVKNSNAKGFFRAPVPAATHGSTSGPGGSIQSVADYTVIIGVRIQDIFLSNSMAWPPNDLAFNYSIDLTGTTTHCSVTNCVVGSATDDTTFNIRAFSGTSSGNKTNHYYDALP